MAVKKQKSVEKSRFLAPLKSWRHFVVLASVVTVSGLIGARLVELHVLDREFLRSQGEQRTLRTEPIDANRGVIRDRHGAPLAVSTPVATLWADPSVLPHDHKAIDRLAELVGTSERKLSQRLRANSDREFIFLHRKVQPSLAEQVLGLGIPGVHSRRAYRRYYPAGEVVSHVLGFTDIDENGQEGLELSFNQWLSGEKGRKRVLRDNRGRTVTDIGLTREARPGNDLKLSLDLPLQYLAYRELKAAVEAHGARGGTIVMLDVRNGQILAMANQPSFNPNDRRQFQPSKLRNRAITDLFEPGSTIKPFTAAAALESGRFRPDSSINTSPGYRRMGEYIIRDSHDYGELSLSEIVAFSSNVGISKVASRLSGERLQDLFFRVGFGQSTGIGFPGEAVGILPANMNWRRVEVAALSYGYGMSINALQLAQAYMVLANGGVRYPVSLLSSGEAPEGERVLSSDVAASIRDMLISVVEEGTGSRARSAIYELAGKTGTVHPVGAKGYLKDEYKALFAGMGPARDPRIVTVVTVDAPSKSEYYGGEVAAPVFGRVMSDALRLLNVGPAGGAELVEKPAENEGGQG